MVDRAGVVGNLVPMGQPHNLRGHELLRRMIFLVVGLQSWSFDFVMRTPKLVETFVASLNELLTAGQLGIAEETVALKTLNHILGALAPGFSVLTMHDVEGRLAGFASKFTPTTASEQHTQQPETASPAE